LTDQGRTAQRHAGVHRRCGVVLCDPIEVAAGNDIHAYRRQFGHKTAFRQGVDIYHQLIDLDDRDILKPFDSGSRGMGGAKASDAYWSEEHGEIKYQVGEGCELDMTIAQWHANLYGLGEIYDPGQARSALAATFKYNYKASLREVGPVFEKGG